MKNNDKYWAVSLILMFCSETIIGQATGILLFIAWILFERR